jgi:hypothetical protein
LHRRPGGCAVALILLERPLDALDYKTRWRRQQVTAAAFQALGDPWGGVAEGADRFSDRVRDPLCVAVRGLVDDECVHGC